jgi:hypothetical protein
LQSAQDPIDLMPVAKASSGDALTHVLAAKPKRAKAKPKATSTLKLSHEQREFMKKEACSTLDMLWGCTISQLKCLLIYCNIHDDTVDTKTKAVMRLWQEMDPVAASSAGAASAGTSSAPAENAEVPESSHSAYIQEVSHILYQCSGMQIWFQDPLCSEPWGEFGASEWHKFGASSSHMCTKSMFLGCVFSVQSVCAMGGF